VTTTPLSSILLVVLASFIGSFGAVFLKGGAGRLERNLKSLIFNWRLAAGVFAFLLSSYFFVQGLRQGELTVLYPMASLSYLWTLLWSRIVFREPFTTSKFVGLGLILIGIVCIGMGSR
jgi:multidrug transporter EmrE-like cation transporter